MAPHTRDKRATHAIPSELSSPSHMAAVSTIFRAVFLFLLGSFAISISPWYLWWLGGLCTSCAMTWLYVIGWDCAQRTFLRQRWGNHLIGVLSTLLLLRPFASLRFADRRNHSIFSRLRRAFSLTALRSLYNKNDWRHWIMPVIDIVAVLLFAAVFFPLLVHTLGLTGLAKYWIFPFVDMQFRLYSATFKLSPMASRAPYLLLFHPEVSKRYPRRARQLAAKHAQYIPSYNLHRLHVSLSQTLSASTVSAVTTPPLAALRGIQAAMRCLSFDRLSRHDCLGIIYSFAAIAVAALSFRSSKEIALAVVALMALFLFVALEAVRTRRMRPHPPNLHWFNLIYLGGCHAVAAYGLVTIALEPARMCSWTVALALGLHVVSMFGIGAGAHRLWAHRSYNASTCFQTLLMFLFSIANQGSIWKWARDHRAHHKHSDTPLDPHSAMYGFFWSHCGWLMYQKDPEVVAAGRRENMSDLESNRVVQWHSRHYAWFSLAACFGLPPLISGFLWGDVWGGLFIAGFARYCFTLHVTWCINSLAHYWGYRPYLPNIPPVENAFLSVLSHGEGWHNFHHSFPRDYSANEFGILQWSPTTALIDMAAAIGLASHRRKATLPSLPKAPIPELSSLQVQHLASQGHHVFIVSGNVYDVEGFLEVHPGGAAILKAHVGKDATDAFYNKQLAHSETAVQVLAKYQIATLAPAPTIA